MISLGIFTNKYRAARRPRYSKTRQFLAKFVIFPNPTDGHWIRAIFGESEPQPHHKVGKHCAQLQQQMHGGRKVSAIMRLAKPSQRLGW